MYGHRHASYGAGYSSAGTEEYHTSPEGKVALFINNVHSMLQEMAKHYKCIPSAESM